MNNSIYLANIYKKSNNIYNREIFVIQKLDREISITYYCPRFNNDPIVFNIDDNIDNNWLKTDVERY